MMYVFLTVEKTLISTVTSTSSITCFSCKDHIFYRNCHRVAIAEANGA
jgi:hypothetical protein